MHILYTGQIKKILNLFYFIKPLISGHRTQKKEEKNKERTDQHVGRSRST